MGSVPKPTVVCKYLNLLDISDDEYQLFNYRTQKLTFAKTVHLVLDAIVNKRTDLRAITYNLRANKALQEAVGLESISASQLSRKLNELPLAELQVLFLRLTLRLRRLLNHGPGIPAIGKLRVIDSTSLTLPTIAGKWAYLSKHDNGVKIHTQLLVVNSDLAYPEKIICSTRGVSDSEVALELVVEDDAIHVMDRGYIFYKHYKHWIEKKIRFVGRLQNKNATTIVSEREVAGNIQRDAEVMVSYRDEQKKRVLVPLRLVEYVDEKGRFYRVVTNVRDRSAEQISEIYRHRWKIELFFKWIKQHLSCVHLFSYKEAAVWNQIYLVMIAYALMVLISHEAKTTRTLWDFMKLMCVYMERYWSEFLAELNRPPTRTSQGRRKKQSDGDSEELEELQSIKKIAR